MIGSRVVGRDVGPPGIVLGHLPRRHGGIFDIGEVGTGVGEERLVWFVEGPEHVHLPLNLVLQCGY